MQWKPTLIQEIQYMLSSSDVDFEYVKMYGDHVTVDYVQIPIYWVMGIW